MVSYMAVLTVLYTAVEKCKANEDGRSWWDKRVALFVDMVNSYTHLQKREAIILKLVKLWVMQLQMRP